MKTQRGKQKTLFEIEDLKGKDSMIDQRVSKKMDIEIAIRIENEMVKGNATK